MTSDLHREYLRLGASLYMPATRPDLASVANGDRWGTLRSVIFCVEDAIAENEVDLALDNLQQLLEEVRPSETGKFIRVRNPSILTRLLTMPGIERIDGFVLPKVTRNNLNEYLEQIPKAPRYWLMPILETAEVFDALEMVKLRETLEASPLRSQILALRIGGNDLLNLLRLRRRRKSTIYETPLRNVIASLALVFAPAGFHLAAPVFEGLNDYGTLARELAQDLEHGLYSKSAIHPEQIARIEAHYSVSRQDLAAAESILCESAPAVFRMHDSMCEPATHRNWARIVVERSRLFGVHENGEKDSFRIQGSLDATWPRDSVGPFHH
jgi:citrate lyase beta subunit